MFRDTLLVTKNKTLKIIAPHLHFGQENKLDIPVNVLGLTPSQIEFFELSYEAKMLSLPLAVSKRIFSFFLFSDYTFMSYTGLHFSQGLEFH